MGHDLLELSTVEIINHLLSVLGNVNGVKTVADWSQNVGGFHTDRNVI